MFMFEKREAFGFEKEAEAFFCCCSSWWLCNMVFSSSKSFIVFSSMSLNGSREPVDMDESKLLKSRLSFLLELVSSDCFCFILLVLLFKDADEENELDKLDGLLFLSGSSSWKLVNCEAGLIIWFWTGVLFKLLLILCTWLIGFIALLVWPVIWLVWGLVVTRAVLAEGSGWSVPLVDLLFLGLVGFLLNSTLASVKKSYFGILVTNLNDY